MDEEHLDSRLKLAGMTITDSFPRHCSSRELP